MTAFQAIILGLVQGLTEFLPVSSSGHLIIVQSLLNLDGEMLMFDAFVHIGTLVAVFIAFWKDIWALIKHPICKFTGMIIIGCIPAALMGYFLDDIFEHLFGSVIAVSCALIVTGILLVISDRMNGKKTIDEMKCRDALLVGVCQGFAITPGLSRSGSTIFGALLCGLNRDDAAKFSFILSIPVILGAVFKTTVLDSLAGEVLVFEWTYVLGAIVAAMSGYFAVRLLLTLLHRKRMRYFSYYVWLLAIIIIVSRIFV